VFHLIVKVITERMSSFEESPWFQDLISEGAIIIILLFPDVMKKSHKSL